MKLLKSKKGFTLIELLVVIGILAVLIAIGIPAVAGLIDRANVSSDEVNANEMTNAMERFASEYELYYQDILSGALDPNNFDGAQGRVHQVTNVTTRDGIEGIEVDTEEEVDEDIIQIFRDTKYPANAKTAKQIILVYTKISGTPFMPKQSDMHFWYHPASGVVIYAEPDSSVADKNKQLQNGVDAKGDPLTDDEVWYDLSLDYTDEEATTALEYYLTLETAVKDANSDTIGANADADASTGKVALYKDNSGATCAKLLSDINISEKIVVERDLKILLNGKTATAKNYGSGVTTVLQTAKTKGITLELRGDGGSLVGIADNGNRVACIVNESSNKLIVENANISVDASDSSTASQCYCIVAQGNTTNAEATLVLNNSNLQVRGNNNHAIALAVYKNNRADITNCNISAWANNTYKVETSPAISGINIDGNGSTAANAPVVNVKNCNIDAQNCAIQCVYSNLTVDGGVYKGNHHGGIYVVGKDRDVLLKNASFEWTAMMHGYTTAYNSGYGNTSGAYFGQDNIADAVIYIDRCNFVGYYYPFRLHGNGKVRTATVYISNSTVSAINPKMEDKIHLPKLNEIYIGKGNNFGADYFPNAEGKVVEVPDGVYNQIP